MEEPLAARNSVCKTIGGTLFKTLPVELSPAAGAVLFAVSSFELQLEPTMTATNVRTTNVEIMRLLVQRFFIAVFVVFLLVRVILFLFAKSK